VIRLSIPLRQALAKLTLPVLIALAFGLVLLGKADAMLAERARMALADALAPIYGALAEPLSTVRQAVEMSAKSSHSIPTTPACAKRTSVCGGGSRWRWRWRRRTYP
jgi:hypothetical protein